MGSRRQRPASLQHFSGNLDIASIVGLSSRFMHPGSAFRIGIVCLMTAFPLTVPVNPATAAPTWPSNEDESKVPQYILPELLRCGDGTEVKTADDWRWKRRPELLRIFEEQMFGKAAPRPVPAWEVTSAPEPALDGKALRKQVRIWFGGQKSGPSMEMLLYVPAGITAPVPFFWGLNFQGNHTISTDPGIHLPPDLPPAPEGAGKAVPPAERGAQSTRWQVEWVLSQGYGTATAWYAEVDPDYHDGFKNGVHALFPEVEAQREGSTWGSVAAWAWALRGGMDYLEQETWCDARAVAVHGHSRLGKTALWAGALDERFSIVISNNSGCGGAALSKRCFGETVGRINTVFPHWFASNYHQWNGREPEMPFDQHQLLALVAPRGLLVGSAEGDAWADPQGEFLAAREASPAFVLLGEPGFAKEAIRSNEVENAGNPVHWQRPGKHDVMESDWKQWTRFAKTRWGK